MQIKWNEYTWYSKLAAFVFFIVVLPIWTFHIGTVYQRTLDVQAEADNIVHGTFRSSNNVVVSTSTSRDEDSLAQGYINGTLRVIKIAKGPNELSELYVAVKRSNSPVGYDSDCGSGYEGGTCYFFLEPTYVYGAKPTKYIGSWSGGLQGIDPNSISFVDATHMHFTSSGGDAGEYARSSWSLNITTGVVTQLDSQQGQ